MKKSKLTKALLVVLCAALLVAGSVLGTLAYLTGRDSVTNTFTVGQVKITVDEADVDENGEPISGADRVTENDYHLIPGERYTKDPMMTVKANSEESYVRMILTVHNASGVQALIDGCGLNDFADLIDGWDETAWLYHGFTEDTAANTISFEFRYKQPVAGSDADQALPALFTELVVPGAATNEELEALYNGGFKMVVEGHAIQTATFEDDAAAGTTAVDAAWAAFDAQVNP